MPAMFAPVHELSRQIQIINAYCREAEHLQDPIHDTLWDLLDELIDAHERIVPRSLFAGRYIPQWIHMRELHPELCVLRNNTHL